MGLSRRDVLLRVIAFTGVTWVLLAVLGGVQLATEGVVPSVMLPQLAPGIAALLLLVVFHHDALRLSFTLGSRPGWRVLVAVLAPLAIAALALSVASIDARTPMSGAVPSGVALAWIVIGAFGEELGWRGYLNQMLAVRCRGLTAAVITGMLWVPFHVGLWGIGPVRFVLFAVGLVGASVVIAALVGDARFSVTLATLFHIALNAGSVVLGEAAVNVTVLGIGAVAWVVTAAIAVTARRRLMLDRAPGTLRAA